MRGRREGLRERAWSAAGGRLKKKAKRSIAFIYTKKVYI
jgi:hypothetical protein